MRNTNTFYTMSRKYLVSNLIILIFSEIVIKLVYKNFMKIITIKKTSEQILLFNKTLFFKYFNISTTFIFSMD